jgi:hypothetical protein
MINRRRGEPARNLDTVRRGGVERTFARGVRRSLVLRSRCSFRDVDRACAGAVRLAGAVRFAGAVRLAGAVRVGAADGADDAVRRRAVSR